MDIKTMVLALALGNLSLCAALFFVERQAGGAARRNVTGDGQHSIQRLIEAQSRRRQAATGGESRIASAAKPSPPCASTPC